MFPQLTHIDRRDFKDRWSDTELEGVRSVVFRIFDEVGYNLRSTTFYTHNNDHAILNDQGNDVPLDEGVYLSHFALTYDGMIVAVGFDEDEEEIYYRLY